MSILLQAIFDDTPLALSPARISNRRHARLSIMIYRADEASTFDNLRLRNVPVATVDDERRRCQ